jgi:hypothetical protein
MRDRHVIIAGAVLVLAVISGPVWFAKASGANAGGPVLKRPGAERTCVLPTPVMRASHMNLLVTWRDQVVRDGHRTWISPDGKAYTASLTGTCLRCHASRAEFCDRCHAYAGVAPACWTCHLDAAPAARSTP